VVTRFVAFVYPAWTTFWTTAKIYIFGVTEATDRAGATEDNGARSV